MTRPTNDRAPWERLPEESDAAYKAFCTYRDLGSERSIERAWKKQTGRTTGENGRWEFWSSRHRWVERVRAWEDHLDEIERAVIERRTRRLARRRAVLEIEYQPKLEKAVQVIMDRVLAHADAPVHDIEVEEERQDYTRDKKPITVKLKTKRKAMKTSGLARLTDALRDAIAHATLGNRAAWAPRLLEKEPPKTKAEKERPAYDPEKLAALSDEELKSLAAIARKLENKSDEPLGEAATQEAAKE